MTTNQSPNVIRGRHIAYTSGGVYPRVVMLPSDICGQDQVFPEARHVHYTSGGISIVATAVTCCDAVFEVSGKAEYSCWSGGIGLRVKARSFNVHNCPSAQFQETWLNYSSGTNDWRGSIPLRGGTMQLGFNCQSGVPEVNADKFRLVVSGCASGVYLAGYQCSEPLRVNFGNILNPLCCACSGTTEVAEINVIVEANCREVIIGRHIGYTPGGIPIVAKDNFCYVGSGLVSGCASMTCGVNATITTTSGDCGCLDGTWPMLYGLGFWETLTAGACGTAAQLHMACNDFPSSGTVCLQFDVTCGATNTGTKTICIPAGDMEDLDETFNIAMTDPFAVSGGCGTCLFQWNEMPMSWSQIGDDCTGDCGCIEPTTPGTIDGEQVSTNCSGAGGVACCLGGIAVRVMRE